MSRMRHWRGWGVAGLLLAAGCGGTTIRAGAGAGGSPGAGTTGAGTGGTIGAGTGGVSGCPTHAPKYHRAEATSCGPSMPQTACKTDADCAIVGPTGGIVPKCTAAGVCDDDECIMDADCTSGGNSVCECKDDPSGGGSSNGNVCLPGNCQTDADCAAGYCSPTVSADCGTFYGTVGFYCHTCEDTCLDDSDCTGSYYYCAFDPTVGHWACGEAVCAG